MRNTKYDDLIQKKVTKSFNRIIPIAAIVSCISAIAVFFSAIPKEFFYYDMGIGITLVVMVILKDRISVEFKIFIGILIPILIGVLTFMESCLNSIGIILILIANLLAVVLLPRIKSIGISVLSSGVFIGLWGWVKITIPTCSIYIRDAEWIIAFIVIILFIAILHILVNSIRGFLIENIVNLEESAEQTYKLAYYDQLTGLPNQNLFKKQLIEKGSKGNRKGFIVFYSLKNLRLINSIYGDEVGNQVIIEMANILNSLQDNSMELARINGNEFAVWIELNSIIMLNEWVYESLQTFKDKFCVPNMKKNIEFYISYATCIKGGKDILDCYQKASMALIYAKRNKKSGIIAYNNTFEKIIRDNENLQELLQVAIEEESFELYYQEKVDATKNEVVGVEALARWLTPTRGMVPPSVFIPVIEQMNRAVTFGEMIIKKGFIDYNRLCSKYNKEITLAINISPTHVMSKGFVEYVSDMVTRYEISEGNITFEITEEIMIEGIEVVKEVLNAIHALGINISIDDFGTGYSSFNYLIKLDVDELKIDKSFIDQLDENDSISILLESVIHIAKRLNLVLVAEGVEKKEQCDRIVQLGCPVIQGYYFSKPEPLQ